MKLYSGIIKLKPNWYIRLPCPMTRMEMSHWRFGPLALPLMIAGVGLQAMGIIGAARGEAAAGAAAAAEQQAAAAQAQSQQAIANYNAQVKENEARAIEQRTAYEQQKQAEEAERRMSTLQAGLGEAGAVTTAGTPLLIQAKQASEFELSNLMLGYEGRTEAAAAKSEAELQRYYGKMGGWQAGVYQQRAKYEKAAGRMRAGTTLLTGFGQTTMMGYGAGKELGYFGDGGGAAEAATSRTPTGYKYGWPVFG
jgi:hypothetical protein